jgi:hypothetical protein
VRAAPAVSRANMHRQKAHTSIQVQRKQSDIPCAMALRLMPRSPRRRIRLVTVTAGLMAQSDPVGSISSPTAWHQQRVSGPHGFAVRSHPSSPKGFAGHGAVRLARADRSQAKTRPAISTRDDAAASTASYPNVRDDGQRPSKGTGWGKLVEVICPTAKE